MEALDGSRLGRAGRVVLALVLALASEEPVLVVVSILTTKFWDGCRGAFEGGSLVDGGDVRYVGSSRLRW